MGKAAAGAEAGTGQTKSKPVRKTRVPARDLLTPAMRQYAEQKAQVPDAILLFRMGDFYETFYEDAKTVSRVLGLTLTARSKNANEPIPLAGVPYHAIDGYVAIPLTWLIWHVIGRLLGRDRGLDEDEVAA